MKLPLLSASPCRVLVRPDHYFLLRSFTLLTPPILQLDGMIVTEARALTSPQKLEPFGQQVTLYPPGRRFSMDRECKSRRASADFTDLAGKASSRCCPSKLVAYKLSMTLA